MPYCLLVAASLCGWREYDLIAAARRRNTDVASDGIHWWQKYGSVGQVTQAVVTAFGVIAALVQINLMKAASQEASAVSATCFL